MGRVSTQSRIPSPPSSMLLLGEKGPSFLRSVAAATKPAARGWPCPWPCFFFPLLTLTAYGVRAKKERKKPHTHTHTHTRRAGRRYRGFPLIEAVLAFLEVVPLLGGYGRDDRPLRLGYLSVASRSRWRGVSRGRNGVWYGLFPDHCLFFYLDNPTRSYPIYDGKSRPNVPICLSHNGETMGGRGIPL